MARESKAKRHERRFGKPERLVDMIFTHHWRLSPGFGPEVASMVDRITSATVIDASNVVEYFSQNPEKDWKWTDLPASRCPFRYALVEYKPSWVFRPFAKRVGILVSESSPLKFFGRLDSEWLQAQSSMGLSQILSDVPMLQDRTETILNFYLIALFAGKRKFVSPVAIGTLFLGDDGRLLRSPLAQIDREMFRHDEAAGLKDMFFDSVFPGILALSFMNCRNVTLEAVEPDRRINRERRKHGLKPFLRYHTINIEPMKRVLKTEGNIETEGLKRALHICRGHFATYTDSMFGRKLEEPVTVWRPAHVRGEAKQGVVLKDYRVDAPKP